MKWLIKVLCVLVLLSLTLTGCKYNDDDVDGNEKKEECPYGNYDYSLKPYFAKTGPGRHYTTVYQNYAFGVNSEAMLSYVDLSDLKREMRSYKRSEEEYEHNGFLGQTHIKVCNEDHANPDDCPAFLYGSYLFLLDAYESAGSYPVFYITRQKKGAKSDSEPYYLYRYSLLNNTKEELCRLKGKPSSMMTYGDYIYVSEAYGTGDYAIEAINKKTKAVTSVSIEKKRIEPIHADGDKVYFYEWLTGTLYVSDRELAEYKPIFTPPELYTVAVTERDIGMFINGGYIYFRDDYEERPVAVPRTEPVQYITPFVYNIKRVALDNPDAESEIVAKDVFEECDHGIYGNYFYFTPFDPKEHTNAYCYNNFSNGRLCRTDLTTLETEDFISDSGLLFEGVNDVYICDRYIICNIRPVTEKGLFITMGDACCYRMIYDFKTNEVYYVDDAEGSGFRVTPMP